MASADSALVIVAVLVAASGLLLASGLVLLKRKTLLRLLFTHRKSTLEKLRSAHKHHIARQFSPIMVLDCAAFALVLTMSVQCNIVEANFYLFINLF